VILTIFDTETQTTYEELGITNKKDKLPSRLKMAIGGILIHDTEANTDKYMLFGETQAKLMIEILKKAELIIAHNAFRFDYPMIQQYTSENIINMLQNNTFDTLIQLEKVTNIWCSLDDLCKLNLKNVSKSEESVKIPSMWRDGQYQKVENYLRNDLKMTKEIYLYIKKNKKVKFTMKDYGRIIGVREIEVDW
jgi:DEAD/DEAH box helicase domain-containing protein